MKPRHDRAAQFAPFAALRGFEEELARMTELKSPRRELSDGEIERIGKILTSLSLGDTVRVTYYDFDRYITSEGILTDLDPIERTLTVVKRRIPFSDLFEICKK